MLSEHRISPLAIDLRELGGRTVTSFYSNLITRPTGRAVRMGVESQIAELEGGRHLCLSILDFSQVRLLDYSCADEIVAKLLLRYTGEDRPAEAFFLARGLQEHHREPVDAVLERHDLLLVTEQAPASYDLIGPCDPLQRACWSTLARVGRRRADQLSVEIGVTADAVVPALAALCARRVAIALRNGVFCAVPALAAAVGDAAA